MIILIFFEGVAWTLRGVWSIWQTRRKLQRCRHKQWAHVDEGELGEFKPTRQLTHLVLLSEGDMCITEVALLVMRSPLVD